METTYFTSFAYFHAKMGDFSAKNFLKKPKIWKKPLEKTKHCPKKAILLSRRLSQLHLHRSFDQVDHTVDTKLSHDTAAVHFNGSYGTFEQVRHFLVALAL